MLKIRIKMIGEILLVEEGTEPKKPLDTFFAHIEGQEWKGAERYIFEPDNYEVVER